MKYPPYDGETLTPEEEKLIEKYCEKFNFYPWGNLQWCGCGIETKKEMMEKVKLCLEKNIDLPHLMFPDYDEILERRHKMGIRT